MLRDNEFLSVRTDADLTNLQDPDWPQKYRILYPPRIEFTLRRGLRGQIFTSSFGFDAYGFSLHFTTIEKRCFEIHRIIMHMQNAIDEAVWVMFNPDAKR